MNSWKGVRGSGGPTVEPKVACASRASNDEVRDYGIAAGDTGRLGVQRRTNRLPKGALLVAMLPR